MADILEGLLESGSAVQSPVLAILAEARQGRKKRKAVNPQPRRGCPHAKGAAQWRIPVPSNAWEELMRLHAADPSSWDDARVQYV